VGTWGLGTFEDDIACDWLEDLHDSDPIAFFTACLDLEGIEELDYLACIGVVCTAEILCAHTAQPRQSLPESAKAWLVNHRELALNGFLPSCVTGLYRVIDPTSEMSMRWEDGVENFEAWKNHILDLHHRLESVIAGNA
jgi:hypothetical protein